MKVYEQNIHDTMKSMPAQRDRRKEDYKRVLTLFDSDSHARERRNKARGAQVPYVQDILQQYDSVVSLSRTININVTLLLHSSSCSSCTRSRWCCVCCFGKYETVLSTCINSDSSKVKVQIYRYWYVLQ